MESTTPKDTLRKAWKSCWIFLKLSALLWTYMILGTFTFLYTEHCYDVIQDEGSLTQQKLNNLCNIFNLYQNYDSNNNGSLSNNTILSMKLIPICISLRESKEIIKCEITFETVMKWLKYSSTTVLTVGYGVIVVKSNLGKIITMIYALPGIAIVISTYVHMANALRYIAKALIVIFETKVMRKTFVNNLEIKIFLSQLLFAVAALFSEGYLHTLEKTENLSFLNGVYLAFCSITTIGFGDYNMKLEKYVKNPLLFIAIGLSFWGGLGVVASCIASLNDIFNVVIKKKVSLADNRNVDKAKQVKCSI